MTRRAISSTCWLLHLLDGQYGLVTASGGLPKQPSDQRRRRDLFLGCPPLQREIELASDAQRQTHLQRGGVLRRFPFGSFGLFLGVLGAHRGHFLGDRHVLVALPLPGVGRFVHSSSLPLVVPQVRTTALPRGAPARAAPVAMIVMTKPALAEKPMMRTAPVRLLGPDPA